MLDYNRREASCGEGPFMLYVAYNAPHTPLQAQEKDIKLYTDNFDSLTPKEQKKVTYSAMVSCMDRGIGAIVDALKKKGIMDNTFFIWGIPRKCIIR